MISCNYIIHKNFLNFAPSLGDVFLKNYLNYYNYYTLQYNIHFITISNLQVMDITLQYNTIQYNKDYYTKTVC